MTRTKSDKTIDVETNIQSKKKNPPAVDEDEDSEDSLPLRKLAAKRKRNKGTPPTKVTMGRKKASSLPSPPEGNNLDFESEEEPKKVAAKSSIPKATKQQGSKKSEAATKETGKAKKSKKDEAKDTLTNTDAASASSADEKPNEDSDLAACCLCHCALDYSDRSAFFEADRRQEIDNKSSGSDDEPLYFQPTDPYLPTNLYDASNALVYCDTCDRLYHQKCHFVPLMVVPRGKWSCLVCTTKDKLTSARGSDAVVAAAAPLAKGKNRKKKIKDIVENREEALFTKHKLSRMFRSPLPPSKLQQYLTEGGSQQNKSYHTGLEMTWELAAARDKAILWTKALTQTVPNWLQSQMSKLSQARSALETLTQTKQNRQHFLENKASKGGSQELAQTLVKLTGAKWKMRQMILNLEEIRANPERHIQLMHQWCQGAKAEESSTGETTSNVLTGPPPKSFTERVLFPFGQYPPRTIPRTPEMVEELERAKNGSDEVPSEILTTKTKPESESNHNNGKTAGDKKKKQQEKKITKPTDGDSSSGVSLDDLVCCVCLSNEATDENDMLLCDAQGCFRAFHMECLEPVMTLKEVEDTEGEDWFCPLCSGMADCIHRIQSYYMGEDWDRRRQERAAAEARKLKSKAKGSPAKGKKKKVEEEDGDNGSGNDGDDGSDDDSLKSWEKPDDVFPESKWEYEIALEMKAGKRNDQTDALLRDMLGEDDDEKEGNLLVYLEDGTDDEEEDAHFDLEAFHEERKRHYEEMEAGDSDDDSSHSSQATLVEMSSVELKIGKDELNALSEGSDSESEDSDSDSDGSSDDSSKGSKSGQEVIRRSRRLRKMQTPEDIKKSAGTDFDVTNIVQGKRRRKPVDYRKLNDALFGGLGADEIANIDDTEDFRVTIPKKKVSTSSGDEDSDDEEDGDSEGSDNDQSGSEDDNTKENEEKKTTKTSRKRIRGRSEDDIGSGNEAEDDDSMAKPNGKKKRKKKADAKPPAKKKRRGAAKDGEVASLAAKKKKNGTKEAKSKKTQNGKKAAAGKKLNGTKVAAKKAMKSKAPISKGKVAAKEKK